MQRVFDPVVERLRSFINQRNDMALVVRVGNVEVAYVLKMIQMLDRGELPDLFFSFVEPFEEPVGYVQSIVRQFRLLFDATREELKEKAPPAWEHFPEEMPDPRLSPADQLKQLIAFSRSLRSAPDGMSVVWSFMPLEVKDTVQYAQLFAGLFQYEMPRPWCHHVRMIVRDLAEDPMLERSLQRARRVQWVAPDMSAHAMEKAMEQDAADDAMPVSQRVQSVLMLGLLDQSHRRFPDAMEKFALVLEYGASADNPTMASLALNAMGEVYIAMERPADAQKYFERALLPAIDGKVWAVLLNISLNLANLHLQHKRWDEAESYYTSAADLAKAMRNVPILVRCKENIGACRLHLKDVRGAFTHWNDAAVIARNVDDPGLLRPVLERLLALYTEANMRKERNEVEAELIIVRKLAPKGH